MLCFFSSGSPVREGTGGSTFTSTTLRAFSARTSSNTKAARAGAVAGLHLGRPVPSHAISMAAGAEVKDEGRQHRYHKQRREGCVSRKQLMAGASAAVVGASAASLGTFVAPASADRYVGTDLVVAGEEDVVEQTRVLTVATVLACATHVLIAGTVTVSFRRLERAGGCLSPQSAMRLCVYLCSLLVFSL